MLCCYSFVHCTTLKMFIGQKSPASPFQHACNHFRLSIWRRILNLKMSGNFEMVFGVIDFLQKTNEIIRFYYYANCFRSFFGGNLRPQKTFSKLTDLYIIHKKRIHTPNYVFYRQNWRITRKQRFTKIRVALSLKFSSHCVQNLVYNMAVRIVEFSNRVYKIRKISV